MDKPNQQIECTKVPALSRLAGVGAKYSIHEDVERLTTAPGHIETLMETQARIEQEKKQRQEVEYNSNCDSKDSVREMLTTKIWDRSIKIIESFSMCPVHGIEVSWC